MVTSISAGDLKPPPLLHFDKLQSQPPISSSPNFNESRITLTKEDLKISAYNRVINLLARDENYQREIAMGKRIGFYKLGEELGSGNFSKVRIGAHILTKERVAIKIVEKSRLDQKAQRLLAREIENMEQTHHPNIIRLFEVLETMTKQYLVLEYAGGGELYDHVVNNLKLTEEESKPLFAQVVSAVIHLHQLGIVHRDIKAENVFFSAPNWVKLGDFGFSVAITADTNMLNTFCGSPPYAAPELFQNKSYRGEYVDVWALGVLLYFMVTGNTPFYGDTVSELKKQILQGQYEIPEYVSPLCQDLITGILKMDPQLRYSVSDIQRHDWMANVSFPKAYEKVSLAPSEDELGHKPAVKEVWDTLHKYGISRTMMKEAAQRGAKSAVIGTYRIVLYQVQSRLLQLQGMPFGKFEMPILNASHVTNEESMQRKSRLSKTSRLCVIL